MVLQLFDIYHNITIFVNYVCLINNMNYYVLQCFDRACAERLAGLADIEFYNIFGQI